MTLKTWNLEVFDTIEREYGNSGPVRYSSAGATKVLMGFVLRRAFEDRPWYANLSSAAK